jgi:transposase
MRQVKARKSRGKLRIRNKGPLVEGIKTKRKCKRFAPDEEKYIIKRRRELEKQEMKDAQIARVISGEVGRCFGSIDSKLRNLVKAGALSENAHKVKSFSEAEIEIIIRRSGELVKLGFMDTQIAEKIAKEIGRSKEAVHRHIRLLRDQNVLSANKTRKKQKRYSTNKKEFIKKRREELALEGLNDKAISRAIANEIQEGVLSIYNLIRSTVKRGELPPNRNKQQMNNFSKSEIQYISEMSVKLSAQGMKNAEIARTISGEIGRSTKSIIALIFRLEKKQELPQNKNKSPRKRFSEEELEYIKARNIELRQVGLKDSQISEIISKETNRSKGAIKQIMNKLTHNGELPKNKNKLTPLSKDEKECIKRRRAELIPDGLNDSEIAQRIEGEIKRPKNSIIGFIRRLIRSMDLLVNPNRRAFKRFDEKEMALIIRRRVELEKKGENDKQISEKIGKEICRNPLTVRSLIDKLIKEGKLKENSNKVKIRKLSESELRFIENKRNELIQQGCNDVQISNVIAQSLQRPSETIKLAIERLIIRKKIPQNPNKKKLPDKDLLQGLTQAADAMEKFGDSG